MNDGKKHYGKRGCLILVFWILVSVFGFGSMETGHRMTGISHAHWVLGTYVTALVLMIGIVLLPKGTFGKIWLGTLRILFAVISWIFKLFTKKKN